jgi:hypothetical protein
MGSIRLMFLSVNVINVLNSVENPTNCASRTERKFITGEKAKPKVSKPRTHAKTPATRNRDNLVIKIISLTVGLRIVIKILYKNLTIIIIFCPIFKGALRILETTTIRTKANIHKVIITNICRY